MILSLYKEILFCFEGDLFLCSSDTESIVCLKLLGKLKEEMSLFIPGKDPKFLSAVIFGVFWIYLLLGLASILPSVLWEFLNMFGEKSFLLVLLWAICKLSVDFLRVIFARGLNWNRGEEMLGSCLVNTNWFLIG